MSNPKLLLATESPYKVRLLNRLKVPFRAEASLVDESSIKGETPIQLTKRLAYAKATKLFKQYPNYTILATDQNAGIGHQILQKPKTIDRAVKMLTKMADQSIVFYTSIALIQSGIAKSHTEEVTVHVRPLTKREIISYVTEDRPLDCVGSFKIESLGISLFKSIDSRDPTALEGLPLIKVSYWLREIGLMKP